MNFNFNFGFNMDEYFRKNITGPIDAMNARIEAQTNSILATADRPRLAVQAQLNRITDSQLAIQKQVEKLTRLPELPNISEIFSSNNVLKDIFDNSSSSRVIMENVTPEYVESEFKYIDNKVENVEDLVNDLIEFNKLYKSKVLNSSTLKTLETAQSLIKNSIHSSISVSLNMTGFYVPESYRIIYNEHFNMSNHFLGQTLNNGFTYALPGILNNLLGINLPPETFIYVYGLLFIISFLIECCRFKH